MKKQGEKMISFQSTKIPMTSKINVEDYIQALPPKDYKTFVNKTVNDCIDKLRRTENKIGIIWEGKDRCFYIFGKTKGQDDFIYEKLKKLDRNVTHIKDVEEY